MHAALFIAKIVGIVLLVLLGIVLLLLLTVFLNPVRYRLDGSLRPEAAAAVRIRWLFGLLRIRASFDPETGLSWQAAFAWIRRPKAEGIRADAPVGADTSGEAPVGADTSAEAPVGADTSDEAPVGAGASGETPGASDASARYKGGTGIRAKIVAVFRKAGGRLCRFAGIFQRIKYTFLGICDKIRTVNKKKEEILAFLRENQAAIARIAGEAGGLLKKLFPKKCEIRGVYGFEDPALTGYAAGALSVLMAATGAGIHAVPDFERKTTDLEFEIGGSFRILYLLTAGFRLMKQKETRDFILEIKRRVS